ncbi:poly(A)-specific ribonuclease [Malassezia japonica]|uniref:PAN2-PAN3 deadenylation complex catalytic subunit PAN2 n=1 Tax=Malassezia japonica TaxID=223818 RepID=A0AAF0F513_9BASI|nr:poly(A)-specific ribonuclease [Malassezia japonica]WFD40697.1 poly(A)-specific ribonuclease [Malassezia japonica]
MAEWTQQAHFYADHAVPGVLGAVSSLYFDPFAELVWAGSASGQVTSHTNTPPSFARYSSYAAHGAPSSRSEVHTLLSDEKAIFSASAKSVRAAQRNGLGRWTVRVDDHAPGLQLAGMCASPLSTSSDVIAGGATTQALAGKLTEQDVLLAVNVNSGRVMRSVPSEAAITHLAKSGRYVCTGTAQGKIQVRDPRSLAVEHQLIAHHGGLIDLQAEGNLVYSIGWTLRQGHRVAEPMIKVHDLRSMQAQVPIPMTAPGGPAFLAVHPKRSSLLAVASPQAQFQMVDTHNPGQSQFYILPSSSYTSSMAFSSSAEALGFGEADGTVRLWTNDTKASQAALPVRFNSYPTKAPALPDYTPPPPRIDWQDDTPLSCVGMPHYDQRLLSAYDADEYWSHGSPLLTIPPQLDAHVLDGLQTMQNVGYAALPKHLRGKRNQLLGTDSLTDRFEKNGKLKRTALARLRGARGDRRVHLARFHSEQNADDDEAWESDHSGMPGYYRLLTIQYSKFGVEDFDFGYYNKTKFSGLETNIPCAYANAYLQALQYTGALRAFAKRHILMACTDPECLLCEAGFLFRMLEDAQGTNCQATNLLRVFCRIPKARTLGLLDDAQDAPAQPYSQLVQHLNHFILGEISQEALRTGASLALPTEALALCANPCAYTLHTHSTCGMCGHRSARQHLAHVVDLVYPPPGTPPAQELAQVLSASFARDAVARGKCRHCHAPHAPHATFRTIPSTDALPAVLSMNANVHAVDQLAQWVPRGERPFLSPNIALHVRHGRVHAESLWDENVRKAPEHAAVYTLRAVLVQVQGAHDAPHLCTYIRGASPEEPEAWTLFNDFLVRPVPADEALRFGEPWKIPALLMWERIDGAAAAHASQLDRATSLLKPDTSLLTTDINIAPHRDPARIRYKVLSDDELPEPGTLVAIDTEFVSLALEEIEMCSDGTRSMIKPSCLALARVSVVRGQGSEEGVPFIDDHIAASEPVVDYLTQYSGIQPGDLDRQMTRMTLVPHKIAYKKLRMLVDRGCRFIGHGLAKDFRIINIYVPPSQVIDTVSLYHSAAHPRNLSLRFLSWFLLKRDIQSGLVKEGDEVHEGHDSIEDADAALQLFRCYQGFEKDNRLEDVLEDLYEVGARVQWRPPVRNE